MAGSRRAALVGIVCALLVAGSPATAAQANELVGAVGDIVVGAMSIPTGILAGTLSGPPVIGTVSGALLGTLNALSLTTRGVLRLAGVAIPLAARLAPLLPVFL